MRRSVLIILSLLIWQMSWAQFQRQEDTNDIEIKDVRTTLKKATGYIYLGAGEWETGKNKIPYIRTQKSSEEASEARLSKREQRKIKQQLKATKAEQRLGQENFLKMELRDVIIDGQAFQLLQIWREKGRFEFPLIKEDFSTYESVEYFVFRADRLEQILPSPLIFNKPYIVDLKVFVKDEISFPDSKNVDALISKRIQNATYEKKLTSYSTTNLLLALYPAVDEGDRKMRFNLIPNYNKAYTQRSYYNEENLKNLFDKKYFETDFERFKDFIGTPSISFQYSDSQPTTFEGFCKLGVNQYQYGDYYNSVANLNKALRMKPNYDHFAMYTHRGNAKYRLGDLYGALEDYNMALDYRPADPEKEKEWLKNYTNRGVVKFHLGDRSEACSDWKRAYEQGVEQAGELLKQHCQ
ncbi:MAG: tetratricopeptide repeat protein [Bacteroidota bacterium]